MAEDATYVFRIRFLQGDTEANEDANPPEHSIEFEDACAAYEWFKSHTNLAEAWTTENAETYRRATLHCDPGGWVAKARAARGKPPLEAAVVPGDQDSPESQGAASVTSNVEMKVDGHPNDPAVIESIPPSDEIFDQSNPLPAAEVYDRRAQTSQGVGPYEEEVPRWLQNRPRLGEPDSTFSSEVTIVPVTGGDPVDLFTGTLTLREVDLEIPAGPLPLRLVRSYRSGRPYFGAWGFNWDHNYNQYIRELVDGSVAHWTGRHHENVYGWRGGAFVSPRGVFERLVRLAEPGSPYELSTAGGTTRRFERPFGWTDPERIPLVKIGDRHGNDLVLRYDDHDRLARVEDDAGRFLVFAYGACGFLVELRDHADRRVVYEIDGYDHLTAVAVPSTSGSPNGTRYCYEYDNRADHPACRHNVIRVVDGGGRTFAQHAYGDAADGWSFNRVVRQMYGDYPYEFEYQQIQHVPADPAYVDAPALQVVVRPPDGSLHTYTFNYRGDLLDHRFRLLADGSLRVVASQWTYDAAGNLVEEVRTDGGRTAFTYDADNPDVRARSNLLRVEAFAPPAFFTTSRVLFEARYDDVFQLPIEVADETGALTRYVYDFDVNPGPNATGKLVRIEFPSATTADGSIQTSILAFESTARGQVEAIVSGTGIRDEIERVASGPAAGEPARILRDVFGVGFAVELSHDAVGFVKERRSPLGAVTQTLRNPLGQLETVLAPEVDGTLGRVHYEFSPEGHLLRRRRPRGAFVDASTTEEWITDEFERDVLGHPSAVVIGANTSTARRWDVCTDHEGRVVWSKDPSGTATRYCFDERGLLLAETIGAGTPQALTSRYAYNLVGQRVRVVHPDGTMTRWEYDPWGRVSRVLTPNGSVGRYVWGPLDRLLVAEVEGNPGDGGAPRMLSKRSFTYDERGRLSAVSNFAFDSDPEQATELVTRYEYDADDRLVRIDTPRGASISYGHDGLDRTTRVEDANGNVEHRTYDGDGRLAEVTREDAPEEGGRVRRWQYAHDARGRRVSRRSPLGLEATFVYDDRDLVVERLGPGAAAERFTYGLLGELTQTVRDPTGLGIDERWSYDASGRLVEYQDPLGVLTTWARDALGRVVEVALADGGVHRAEYDELGRLARAQTPAGSRFDVTYDSAGRLAKVDCIPGPGVQGVSSSEYGYDGLDRLVRADTPTRIVRRGYDSLDRMRWESTNAESIRIDYDDIGGTVELRYPDDRWERIEIDAGGRPRRVSVLAPGPLGAAFSVDVSYEGTDLIRGMSYDNHLETRLEYDADRRLVKTEHLLNATVIDEFEHRYDRRSRRRLTRRGATTPQTRVHFFDAVDRLVAARWAFTSSVLSDGTTQAKQDADIDAADAASTDAMEWVEYEVDAAGSRTSMTRFDGSATASTSYQRGPGHRLLAAGSETFEHSPDGARTSDAMHVYDVDALGRTVRVRPVGSSTAVATFEYDALSRGVAGTIRGLPFVRKFIGESWVHDSGGHGVRQRTLHPTWPVPLAERSSVGESFLLTDGAHSIAVGTTAEGSPAERVEFAPFGAPKITDAAGVQVIAAEDARNEPVFAGSGYLAALGLHATGSRLLDSRHGVFLSPEPFLFAGGANRWGYAHHNPVDFLDARGTDPQPTGVGGGHPGPPGTEGGFPWSAEEYEYNVNRARPRRAAKPLSAEVRGVANVGLGVAGMLVGFGVIATGGSVLVLLGGALLIAGSAVQTGTGLVQGLGGAAGIVSDAEAGELGRGLGQAQSIASLEGLPVYVATAVATGDPESASLAADLAGVAGGFGEAGYRLHKFRKAYLGIVQRKGIEPTFTWGDDVRDALREAYGVAPDALLDVPFATATRRSGEFREVLEFPHAIPQRSQLLPLWLRNSPVNVLPPQWGSYHALSDGYRFQFAPRAFKEQFPRLLGSWERWRPWLAQGGKFSPYWDIVAPLRSVPPWLTRSTSSGLHLLSRPFEAPKK